MVIQVISAAPLTDDERAKIEKRFSVKHPGQKPVFSYSVDQSLLGGLLVIDGDDFYDASLKRQMTRLVSGEAQTERVQPTPAQQAQRQAVLDKLTEQMRIEPLRPDIGKLMRRLDERIDTFKPDYTGSHAGRVCYSGDGVIRIEGLKDAEYDELLDVEGVKAIAFNLEEDNVGAIVLDDEDKVQAGAIVHSTGRIVEVPVGEALLGRVVNPLGVPIDGLGEVHTDRVRPIEAAAPAIADRGKVNTPLQTGIMAIDAMIPIGRGQRELIIGDRQTGKSSIAIDTILNQKGKGVYCVYVAIGQKSSTVSGLVHTLGEYGALDYTVVVCSTARDSAPMQYIAPYAGCAIAEEFMYAGRDVLIVYDDLSKHAVAYRAMSLLLKRPPGREAYPGDIFYLHSRLLERAAKLSDALGGGSMTALPIVETLAGDISAYVPTNIISITDGQIYLESELFNAGIRPAVNVGLSVSRVGSSAQIKGMRKVSGKLRLDLSQYRELQVFTQFGSDLDAETKRMLDQGARATETLKQPLHASYAVEQQIILLYLINKELLGRVPTDRIGAFNKGFLEYLEVNGSELYGRICANGDVSMEDGIALEELVDAYYAYFFKK
ncbi:MAG: F0F1 ATP synthase subunit alpha [Clostridia bacterium]|jgi:F-type H+-transporting ATPase subunit alpha|nr:F0F1 ATP synthase subunit alpha [Clostridia bacterium]